MSTERHDPHGTEATLADAMHAATAGFQPPTAELVRGGLARGRRMRAVRRAQVTVAALAVVAIGGAGTVALSDLGSGSGKTNVAGSANQPNTSASAPPAPGTPQTPPVTAQQVFDTIKSLLPAPGTVTDVVLNDATGGSTVGVKFTYDPDGKGAADVVAHVEGNGQDPKTWVCPSFPGYDPANCTITPLPDGSTLHVRKDREFPMSESTADGKAGPSGGGAKEWSAQIARPDGVQVFIYATDSIGEKTGHVTRSAPVLTLEQLKAVVTSPLWGSVAPKAAMPTPVGKPTGAKADAANAANSNGTGWGAGAPAKGGTPSTTVKPAG